VAEITAVGVEPAVHVAQAPTQVAIDLAAARVDEKIRAIRGHYDALLAERDVRYRERFEASQTALQAALVEREKAVNAALAAAEKLNTASLINAERAVLKAEAAAERRFESVNEFRQTLSDQAASLITRNEVNARFEAMAEKIDGGLTAIGKDVNANASRLDRMDGNSGGVDWLARALAGGLGLLLAVGSVVAMLARALAP
jgi:hypothetical protein